MRSRPSQVPVRSILQNAAGNITKTPKPSDWTTAYDLTYDAWNRLVKVMDGASTVATYAYDGQNRRTIKISAGTTRHYHYSSQWQILEERVGVSTTADRQFVWGLRYKDDLILRDRGAERFYALLDYFNCTAIVEWVILTRKPVAGSHRKMATWIIESTPFGTGVDGSGVSNQLWGRNAWNDEQNVTTYDNATVDSGTVVNDLQFAYNLFSQLITEYQSHPRAVNIGSLLTPNVQYGYADGTAATIRPTAVTLSKWPSAQLRVMV